MKRKRDIKPAFIAALSFLFIIMMLIDPKRSISAASRAVTTWLDIILPSLFPFSAAALIIIRSGVLNGLFSRFEKTSRKVFGFGEYFIFVFLSSCISGYPMGAKLTAELEKNGALSQDEAGLMKNAASTCGPFFLIGSVAGGMLKNSALAGTLVLCHYLPAVVCALMNGFFCKKISSGKPAAPKRPPRKAIGEILSGAVTGSIDSLLAVLGFMVFFTTASSCITGFISLLGLDANTAKNAGAFISGVLEMSSGCALIADTVYAPVMISFFCGFGGFSIIAQSMSINRSNRAFMLSKLFQGCLSALMASLATGSPVYISLLFLAGALISASAAAIRIKRICHFSFLPCRRIAFSFKRSMLSL